MNAQAIAAVAVETEQAAHEAVEREVQRAQVLTDLELEHVGGGYVIVSNY